MEFCELLSKGKAAIWTTTDCRHVDEFCEKKVVRGIGELSVSYAPRAE